MDILRINIIAYNICYNSAQLIRAFLKFSVRQRVWKQKRKQISTTFVVICLLRQTICFHWTTAQVLPNCQSPGVPKKTAWLTCSFSRANPFRLIWFITSCTVAAAGFYLSMSFWKGFVLCIHVFFSDSIKLWKCINSGTQNNKERILATEIPSKDCDLFNIKLPVQGIKYRKCFSWLPNPILSL